MQAVQYGYMPGYSGNPAFQFTKDFDRRVAVSFDTIETDLTADYRVLVQCEPPVLYRDFVKMVYDNADKFDLILAYNPELLKLPNAKLFVPAGSWIQTPDIVKHNQITYMMSSKIYTPDHRLRFMILRRMEKRTIVGDFEFKMYRSPPRIPTKDPYFQNAKFNIACENQVMHNMFSEKILDCFITKTVPIYYGCINIGEFFNPAGVVPFFNIEQLENILKNITPAHYDAMADAIEENYQRALPYWEKSIYQRLEEFIAAEIAQLSN